jgi:hypothetical protein
VDDVVSVVFCHLVGQRFKVEIHATLAEDIFLDWIGIDFHGRLREFVVFGWGA